MYDMIILGTNMITIYSLLTQSPLMCTFTDIIQWRTSYTLSVFVLYTFSYTVLLAPCWQYPIFVAMLLVVTGVYTARNRSQFDKRELAMFSNDCTGEAEEKVKSKGNGSPGKNYSSQQQGQEEGVKEEDKEKTVQEEEEALTMTEQYKRYVFK